MKYNLYHNDIYIAKVEQTNADFLSISGKYTLLQNLEESNKNIAEYIIYSIKASSLMEKDNTLWEAFMLKEEHKYFDLIESENWFLMDEIKKKHKILIPNFYYDNYIVWRWKFE